MMIMKHESKQLLPQPQQLQPHIITWLSFLFTINHFFISIEGTAGNSEVLAGRKERERDSLERKKCRKQTKNKRQRSQMRESFNLSSPSIECWGQESAQTPPGANLYHKNLVGQALNSLAWVSLPNNSFTLDKRIVVVFHSEPIPWRLEKPNLITYNKKQLKIKVKLTKGLTC